MLDVDLLVAKADSLGLGGLNGLLNFFGESVEVHVVRTSSSIETRIAY